MMKLSHKEMKIMSPSGRAHGLHFPHPSSSSALRHAPSVSEDRLQEVQQQFSLKTRPGR